MICNECIMRTSGNQERPRTNVKTPLKYPCTIVFLLFFISHRDLFWVSWPILDIWAKRHVLKICFGFFCQICSEICSRFVGEDLRGGDLSNKGKSPAKEEQLEMIEGEEGASTDHDVLFVYIRRRRRTMMMMMMMTYVVIMSITMDNRWGWWWLWLWWSWCRWW